MNWPVTTTNTIVNKVGESQYHWSCPQCPFNRIFSTESGAINRAAEHMMANHRTRVVIEGKVAK